MIKNTNKPIPFRFTSFNYLLVVLFCIFQYSCTSVSTDICDVCQHPSDYQNPITLRGKVTESSSVLGYSLFSIKDKSKDCSLMVLSNKISPSPGKSIKVKGVLKEISNFNNNRKLILVEEGIDFEKIRNLLSSSFDLFLNQ